MKNSLVSAFGFDAARSPRRGFSLSAHGSIHIVPRALSVRSSLLIYLVAAASGALGFALAAAAPVAVFAAQPSLTQLRAALAASTAVTDETQRGFPSLTPPPDPTSKEYVQVLEIPSAAPELFNQQTQTSRTVIWVGMVIVIDDTIVDGLWRQFNGATDIKRLVIKAQTVIFRSLLTLPGDVVVYASTIRFEANPGHTNQDTAALVTTPRAPLDKTTASAAGDPGQKGGDIELHYAQFYSAPSATARLSLLGSRGGSAGGGSAGRPGLDCVVQNELGQPSQAHNDEHLPDNACVLISYNQVLHSKENPTFIRWIGTPGVVPTSGTDAVPAGMPGAGGAGGNLSASTDLTKYATLSGGPSGTPGPTYKGGRAGQPSTYVVAKVDDNSQGRWWHYLEGSTTQTTHAGADAVSPPAPAAAPTGRFTVLPAGGSQWATVDYLRIHLRFAIDAYKVGQFAVAQTEFAAIQNEIAGSVAPGEDPVAVAGLKDEVTTLQNRLQSGRTFWNAPINWAPLISLSVAASAADRDIQRALAPIYLSYLVGIATRNLQDKLAAVQSLRQSAVDDLAQQGADAASSLAKIQDLQAQAQIIADQIDRLTAEAKAIEADLIQQAKNNIENAALQKKVPVLQGILREVSAIAKMTPLTAPLGSVVDTAVSAMNFLKSVDSNTPWIAITQLPELATQTGTMLKLNDSKTFAQAAKDYFNAVKALKPSVTISNAAWQSALTNLETVGSPIQDGAKSLTGVLTQTTIAPGDLAMEVAKVESADPVLHNLAAELNSLMNQKTAFAQQVSDLTQAIASAQMQSQKDLAAVASFDRQTSANVGALDNDVLSRIQDMATTAQDRLLRYQQLICASYQWEMVQSYPGSLDLNRVISRIQQLAQTGPATLSAADMSALVDLFKSDLAAVVSQVIDYYSQNYLRQEVPFILDVNPAQLAALNRGEEVTFNLKQAGLYPPTVQNVRIVGVQFGNFQASAGAKSNAQVAQMTVYLTHSGVSQLSVDGHTHEFVHYWDTQNPVRWGAQRDVLHGVTSQIRPSSSVASMIASLAGTSDSSLSGVFASVGDGDMQLSVESYTDTGEPLHLDSLQMQVTYEFTPVKRGLQNLEINASGGPRPLIQVTPSDSYQRPDGYAPGLNRSFATGTTVKLNPQAVFGAANFSYWTDGAGNKLLSDIGTNTLTVQMNGPRVVTAVYAMEGIATPAVAPVFSQQPSDVSVVVGQTISLSSAASGAPTPTYQWQKDGINLQGATNTTLVVGNAMASNAGRYSVTATNSGGATTSQIATVTVYAAASVPVISTAPLSQSAVPGSSVTLTVTATGTPTPTLQWQKNGIAIPGAIGASLVLTNVSANDAAFYTVTLTNSAGSVTSLASMLTVGSISRLTNLSIRARIGAGEALIAGLNSGPALLNTNKTVLIRGSGPALGQFGISGFVPDPVLALFNGSTLIATNDNWSSNTSVIDAAMKVGAFPYQNAASKDAALLSTIGPGSYTAQVTAGTASGIALLEVYDTTPDASVTATTPRLLNLSARTRVGTGEDILVAGFNITGSGAKTLLIRAVGPGLNKFGVIGTLADPMLAVFQAGNPSPIAANDNWGGSATLISIFSQAGAFALEGTSTDAVLLVTLAAGSYTAQVTGVHGGTGVALVEIYELQ